MQHFGRKTSRARTHRSHIKKDVTETGCKAVDWTEQDPMNGLCENGNDTLSSKKERNSVAN